MITSMGRVRALLDSIMYTWLIIWSMRDTPRETAHQACALVNARLYFTPLLVHYPEGISECILANLVQPLPPPALSHCWAWSGDTL